MPNKPSAKKALRQTIKRHQKNVTAKDSLKKMEKSVIRLAREKKSREAKEALRLLTKALDKAAGRHIISKNAASRIKSRAGRAVNAAI
ncbi:30S ribosomal protein S20 [Patescibacteria group bacterium]|nr:MAG: 30S ribosomal protein S20 [Patescibacteria group bacterium]